MPLTPPNPLLLTGLPADRLAARVAREVLASGRAVRLAARGWSMRPFLRDGDIVEIAPASPDALMRGDIAAYADPPGEDGASITIHRFQGRAPGGLLFQGDASPRTDPPVPEEALLGRVVARERRRTGGRGGEQRARRIPIGAGWRRKTGRLAIAAGPALRGAMEFYRRILDLWRGGPPLPLGAALEEARDRVALALALGQAADPDEFRSLFGEKPLETILETPGYQPLAASIAWQQRLVGPVGPVGLVGQVGQARSVGSDGPGATGSAGSVGPVGPVGLVGQVGQARADRSDRSVQSTLADKENRALVLSAQFEDMLRFLARTLHQAGTELLVVKGIAMAFNGTYPAPHLRLGGDIDTLCRPGEERRVTEILLREGFENAEPEYPLSYYFAYRNEVALRRNRPRWPFLEIHWGPAGHLFYNRRLPLARLWESSCAGPWGPGLRVLSPEMELVHAIAHLTKHLRHLRPVWALDIAHLARGGVDWRRVEEEIRHARLERPARFVLRYVERRAAGTLPRGLLERLRCGRRLGPSNWLETRVLHVERDGQARWIEALCLPTWRQRLGYLREMIAPSRFVMERLYPGAKGRPLFSFYLRRGLRLAGMDKGNRKD